MKRQRPPAQVQGNFFQPVHAQFSLGIVVEAPAIDLHRFDKYEEEQIERLYAASAAQARRDYEKILGPLEAS